MDVDNIKVTDLDIEKVNENEVNVYSETKNDSQNEENVTNKTEPELRASDNSEDSTFKVPRLIGPKLPQVQNQFVNKEAEDQQQPNNNLPEEVNKHADSSSKHPKTEKSPPPPVSYKEPYWSGTAKAAYHVEILKSGVIVDRINLNTHPFYVIGRLTNCNIVLEHPSISRYHAVIQYRSDGTEENPPGFYLYDLNSTHGTFLNKQQIQARRYYRLRVGYMFKFGGSSRTFILQGPDDDQEEELELTVTELKELRKQQEEKLKKLEMAENDDCSIEDVGDDQGIDWGMGEDAEEEDDLSENPFALDSVAPNEDLYIDDPKKTLRGWFEREGYDLEYDVEDKGYSQFTCRVQLPLDSPSGGSVFAEATVKGKKKEAVVACALEACRILDKHGLLRQANHESRKRKQKNWEEEDYYDSDEDTYLDRTGSIEKKRQQRIQRAGKEDKKIETYDSLITKLQEIKEEIKNVENLVETSQNSDIKQKSAQINDEADELDAYMSSIQNEIVVDKCKRTSLKQRLSLLRQEELRIQRLVNIAKPTTLPEIKFNPNHLSILSEPKDLPQKLLPLTGAMKGHQKHKLMIPNMKIEHQKESEPSKSAEFEEEETEESNEDLETPFMNTEQTLRIENPVESDSTNGENNKIPNLPMDKQAPVASPKYNNTNIRKAKIRKKSEQSFEYDASNPDYALWMPPTDQSGDGKTKLNEKYGY